MIFGSALSGLNAATTALKTTGNNIANSDTTGFKSSRVDFGDVYGIAYNGISNLSPGQGVKIEDIAQNFSQGNFKTTGNNLDLSISGNGFFALDDSGGKVYSRAGAFQVNRDGNVVNAQGQKLLAFAPVGNAGTQFNSANPQPLNVATGEGAPKATSKLSALINLDAGSNVLGSGQIDPSDPTTFTYSTPGTVYDSLGATHSDTLYFRRIGDDGAGNSLWNVRQYVDGNLATPSSSAPGDAGAAQLTFDNNGNLIAPGSGTVAYDPLGLGNGAAQLNLSLNLAGSTQYGDANSTSNITSDGYSTGRLQNISVDKSGIVSASYTNGQSKALGKVAMANFASPNGLEKLGDTSWGATYASGDAQLGAPGSNGIGQIQSGGLEESNVDLSQQLVNLITEQRDFQANAKTITTANAITQSIINLR